MEMSLAYGLLTLWRSGVLRWGRLHNRPEMKGATDSPSVAPFASMNQVYDLVGQDHALDKLNGLVHVQTARTK
jgi:hypothetical protein